MSPSPHSVVIANLNVVRIAIDKPEADPPLIIYGDRVLALSISSKGVESIARRHFQVVEAGSQIHVLELAGGSLGNIGRKPLSSTSRVELLSPAIRERLDHQPSVTRHVTRGNRDVSGYSAAVQRPLGALTSAAHVHNVMTHLRRARDAVSRPAATACYTGPLPPTELALAGWGSSRTSFSDIRMNQTQKNALPIR
jgi:hypothetical protein